MFCNLMSLVRKEVRPETKRKINLSLLLIQSQYFPLIYSAIEKLPRRALRIGVDTGNATAIGSYPGLLVVLVLSGSPSVFCFLFAKKEEKRFRAASFPLALFYIFLSHAQRTIK